MVPTSSDMHFMVTPVLYCVVFFFLTDGATVEQEATWAMRPALRATTVSIVRECVHVYVHREVRVDACVQHEVCTKCDNSK